MKMVGGAPHNQFPSDDLGLWKLGF